MQKRRNPVLMVTILVAILIVVTAFVKVMKEVEQFQARAEEIASIRKAYADAQVKENLTIPSMEELEELQVTKKAAKENIQIDEDSNSDLDTCSYTQEELDMLAHLIGAEATIWYDESCGKWRECSDEWQVYVGCVVLNRIESENYPNTMQDVIFQKGQYACTWDGGFYKEPVERAYVNAQRVLEGYRPVPRGVIGQAGFAYGEVWMFVGNTYFFYGS